MRKLYAVCLTAILCLSGLLLYGQTGKRASGRSRGSSRNVPAVYVPTESINVDMILQHAPEYNIGSRKTRIGNSDIPEAFKQWMVNEISFSISCRPEKRGMPLVLENLKVELYVFAPGQARDGASFRWFCGIQNLHCVVADPDLRARKYWASLFLPSSYVFLHFPQERGKYSLRSLEGVVVISDKDNKILGRKAFGYRTKLTVGRAQNLVKSAALLRGKKTRNQVVLWPREKTPWACLDADRFEMPAVELGGDFKPSGAVKLSAPPAEKEVQAKENEE